MLQAGEDHPVPDVYFHYQLKIQRGRLFLLHETRWVDRLAQEAIRDHDEDGDGLLSDAEAERFAQDWAMRVKKTFRLEIQGEPVELGDPDINFDTHEPTEEDLAEAAKITEKAEGEVNVRAYDGITYEVQVFLDFEVPLPEEESIRLDLYEGTYQEEVEGEGKRWSTNSIEAYGEDCLTFLFGTMNDDPLHIIPHIELEFDWSGRGPSTFSWEEYEDPNVEIRDALTGVIVSKDPIISLAFVLSLIVCFGWGMIHALAPGHGKAIVAAYLVGTRGRKRDAVWLGLMVTFFHTFSVILLAILMTLVLSATEEKTVEKWLIVASGIGIILLGGWLFIRGSLAWKRKQPVGHHHHHHHHHHDHHDHDHHHHDQGHHHHHHHQVPTSFGELLALGLTGGIVPCPGALMAFLLSLQLGMGFRGLLVVLSFSMGLAIVLVAIGLMMVTSSRFLERVSGGKERMKTIFLVLPLVSAVAIIVVGVIITCSGFLTGPG